MPTRSLTARGPVREAAKGPRGIGAHLGRPAVARHAPAARGARSAGSAAPGPREAEALPCEGRCPAAARALRPAMERYVLLLSWGERQAQGGPAAATGAGTAGDGTGPRLQGPAGGPAMLWCAWGSAGSCLPKHPFAFSLRYL